MWNIGVYIAIASIAVGVSLAIVAAFLVIQWRRSKKSSSKMGDLELQQLSLSIRTTTSEKKVSFEGSQSTFDGQRIDATTPHKLHLETFTVEELKKATEDFNSANLIEGCVYHGRLKGKNLAIKCTKKEIISKVDFALFQDAVHKHSNMIRLLGTCLTERGSDSFLVFEYAKNGSLKDWLHGGLAMKSHFIASCSCFLTWSQRLRICLDAALALQYMHHIMNPPYVHRNIKSRNIFLDEEFNAKIGNFGMARCSIEDEDADLSCWSRGYLAPEYLQNGVISPSIDIFAYGVVVLEVLSGKTAIIYSGEEEETRVNRLTGQIKSILASESADKLREWMASVLGESYSFDAAVMLANLARACTEKEPALRPSATEIVEKLSKLVEEGPTQGEQSSLINESCSKPLGIVITNHDQQQCRGHGHCLPPELKNENSSNVKSPAQSLSHDFTTASHVISRQLLSPTSNYCSSVTSVPDACVPVFANMTCILCLASQYLWLWINMDSGPRPRLLCVRGYVTVPGCTCKT
ncbi:hypothetical protein Ancab_002664 [Ancistrocladus abbreviatus]